jgi:hypothetical protein
MAKAVKKAAKKAPPKKKIAKKAAPKKAENAKSETGIKYADKSVDQPELVPIFDEIKKMMLPYGKGSIKIRGGSGGQIILVSDQPVEINGQKRDEYWFCAALVQRGYVGFYFMPAKTDAEKKEVFKPELLKCLKGKSCFHIKKADAIIFKQIDEALAKGYRICKQNSWVK